MENTPKALLKICRIKYLLILPIQQQKNSIDFGIFTIAYATENSSFDITLMRKQSVRKVFAISKVQQTISTL